MKSWGLKWNYRITVIVTVIFMAVSAAGFYLTQNVLLQNAQNFGNEVATRYAEVELQDVRSAELLLMAGVWTMEEQTQAGASRERLAQWAEHFFQQVSQTLPSEVVPYAILDGQALTLGASGSLEPGPALDDITWYQQVAQSDGQAMFSYTQANIQQKQTAIVVAQKSKTSENILAFELYFKDWNTDIDTSLPEGCSFYLCSASGDLLYAKTQLQVEPEELQEHIRTIFDQIQAGNLDGAQEYIYDLLSEKRAVYFHTHENGGMSIITIPYSSLLGRLQQAFYLLMFIFFVTMVFYAFFALREYQMQKRLSRTNTTVAALGNLYYSIYRVNWAQGTYEAIKNSPDMEQRIAPTGRYEQLLAVIGQVIDQHTFEQFKTSFSLDNIHRLVEQNTHDFGGDFRRLFGSEYRWVNVRLLFDASLQQNEAILCFRQVDQAKTQQLQQINMLEEALDQARESEASQERFFSQMSHDMRTPLSVILATVELAHRKGQDWEKMTEYLNNIQVSASHLMELINDILEISRMEQTDLRLTNAPCDLQETITQCLSAFQLQADLEHKDLSVSFDLIHPKVYADAFRLQQVLNNLISNALKFTHEGDRIQVTVSQSPQQDRDICRITVSDTGIGMSEEFLPQLFTPYARESRFGTQTVLGTGLGMTIVKAIISRMKGEIQVDSALGKGTTFTLTIPMEPSKDETPSALEEVPQDQTDSLQGKQVLLAEDFEMNLQIATELLKLHGAQVTQARNGQEALNLFQASQPGWFDVILMDMNMPVMDGCQATAAIRALDRPDAATIPILAVTANAFAEDVMATARAGMNAHITKPIDLNELAAVLRGLSR